MNISREAIQAQLLAVDNSETEKLLAEALSHLSTSVAYACRMTPSWDANALWVRFDILGMDSKFITTIRVPLNQVPRLKAELDKQGDLENLMVEIRDKIRADSETLIGMLEGEMFKA